ncbi:MAG TPA: VOC family protein [Gaiellaceae bacterium]|nr:VOC family protein [Gaiellaceae bacterium]
MTELNAIGIVVADMGRSQRFYRALGLDVPDTPGEEHISIELPNGVRLMLDTEDVARSFLDDWRRGDGDQISFALECASPAEVDELHARVVAAGFESRRDPWDAYWGQRYAVLRDADGVRVNLYATL